MNNLNTDPLHCMKLSPDKSNEFNHSDKEFEEVLEDGLKLNDQVLQLKKQAELQSQDHLALIERNRQLEIENAKLKAVLAKAKGKVDDRAKEEAKAVIRDLQVLRDSYSVGTSGRNAVQQAINFIMKQFDIEMFEVPSKFNVEAVGADMVNEPPHYRQHAMECIDEMVEVFGVDAVIDYCKCNVWKYRYRAPYKDDADEDNMKSDWYMHAMRDLKEYGRVHSFKIVKNDSEKAPDND